MKILKQKKSKQDLKLFFILTTITLLIFVFTSDGHRYTIDEDMAQQQTMFIVTMKPHPEYVDGESGLNFQFPFYKLEHSQPCLNAILCTVANIGHSITQVPFVWINHNFHIISEDTVKFSLGDFDDAHYVFWRNSLDPDFTFLELTYGPFFSALSVGIFFLLCREFEYSHRLSTTLSLFYGLTTIVWAYSQTSLNGVPAGFFVLLSFLFFIKFRKNTSYLTLILLGTTLGFGFLIRPDMMIVAVIITLFLIYDLLKQNKKIKKLLCCVSPIIFFYGINLIINFLRYGPTKSSEILSLSVGTQTTPFHVGIFGLILSPGVGMLIFSPILFTIFLAFPDFYKRNKSECLLFLIIIAIFLIFYGTLTYWHGLIGWGPRYLLPIISIMLIPLGATMEKRKNNLITTSIIILAILGVFFNLIYLVQDVSWFVWGLMGENRGLFALGFANPEIPLRIHPLTIWTFEYSQLTHSMMLAFDHLQTDILLLKIMGKELFFIVISVLLVPPLVYLIKTNQKLKIIE